MALLLVTGCFSQDDVTPLSLDASDDATLTSDSGGFFNDAVTSYDAPTGPTFNGGGPFACGGCICDGTLYGCLVNATADSGCGGAGGGGPKAPLDDGAAADASTCDPNVCHELPVVCLPKPTCDCITKATGLPCSVDPTGNGFDLGCALIPIPPP